MFFSLLIVILRILLLLIHILMILFPLGQIKLNFRFSSPPAPLKMPRPTVFYLGFFFVKSVNNAYINQSKFKSYLPFSIKSRVVLFIAQEQVQNGKISARKVVLLNEKDDMPE